MKKEIIIATILIIYGALNIYNIYVISVDVKDYSVNNTASWQAKTISSLYMNKSFLKIFSFVSFICFSFGGIIIILKIKWRNIYNNTLLSSLMVSTFWTIPLIPYYLDERMKGYKINQNNFIMNNYIFITIFTTIILLIPFIFLFILINKKMKK